jgi:hypothetical protein
VGGRKRGVDGENDALKEDKKKKLEYIVFDLLKLFFKHE